VATTLELLAAARWFDDDISMLQSDEASLLRA